jgi:hypothetical protein
MAGEDFWATFGKSSEFQVVECDSGGSLASNVLSAYGIPCKSSIGGSLPNLDIKRMDAIQVIKLSLLEASASSGDIYEPVVDSDGVVDFIVAGSQGGISGQIYYEIQSGSYIESCGGVMVTGAMPLAKRKDVEWKPIWQGGTKEVYDTSMLVNEHCLSADFSQQATIVFNDPHLDSSYEDGIDNLYEINENNPFDHILGYAKYIEMDEQDRKEAVVKKEDTAKIVLPLTTSTLGTLMKRPDLDNMSIADVRCYESGGTTPTDVEKGVKVEIPSSFRYENVRGTNVDKFHSIVDVYVVGLEINDMRGIPPSLSEAANKSPTKGSAVCTIRVNKSYQECFKLSKGTHYVVGYAGDGAEKEPYIVFADNSRDKDPIEIKGEGPTPYVIAKDSAWTNNGVSTGQGLILPVGSTHGILVFEVFVSVILETPSIVVYHPDGKNRRAKTIADNLIYWVAPLVSVEEPRPVAFNGSLIDMSEGIVDHDPTTAQALTDTEYERALDTMTGNGMALSLSFLEGEQCATLSEALFAYLNSGGAGGIESTFVCGPGADAQIGGRGPGGGIVNSITYSYQDSNSYTISVNCGPTIVGDMAQIEGGPSPMRSEDISAVGTVIQDMGNHVNYKVRIDGYGERIAVNLSYPIIRVGDKVSCTIHNNPVES